jgi:hypothetical protein
MHQRQVLTNKHACTIKMEHTNYLKGRKLLFGENTKSTYLRILGHLLGILSLDKQRFFLYNCKISHLFVRIDLCQWCMINNFAQNIQRISFSSNSNKGQILFNFSMLAFVSEDEKCWSIGWHVFVDFSLKKPIESPRPLFAGGLSSLCLHQMSWSKWLWVCPKIGHNLFKTSQPKKKWWMCHFSLTFYIFDYQTIYILYIFFLYFLSLHFPWFLLSFGACLRMMEEVSNFCTQNMKNVRVLHEKGVSNASSHSWEKK